MFTEYFKQDKNVNLCAPRAYFVPFEKGQAYSANRQNSNRFIPLNGTWNIREYETVYDAENFLNEPCTGDIPVPSCVQYYGYDHFQYSNCYYPFPFAYGVVPNQNPAFHFTRTVNLKKRDGEKVYLVTEGVDSCFYLYINKQFVGFSQIAHKLGEFDITPYVVDGENTVDMLVVKWCFGSYLECQDKWRFTGIFRDIYLLTRPSEHIVDYKMDTEIDGADGIVTLSLQSTAPVKVTCNGESKTAVDGKAEFRIANAKLWSAETPNLYDITLECNGEVIYEKIGIRTAKIENGLFLVNGKPVKLYGVNRHDFHPKKGMAVSDEDIKNDLLLMKKLNVNAIRTSHYPSAPYLYTLCDELGFYVMSESDVEAHGACAAWNDKKDPWAKGMSTVADDPAFAYTMTERQYFNVHNNKNRACVVIWSLGNESGFGINLIQAAHAVKALDPTRPLHYESAQNCDPAKYTKDDFYTFPLDMVSRMYASTNWLTNEYLVDEKETRPMVYCEYEHAMGNGPGALKDYWDIIEKHERLMGAFIWEWADHGVTYGDKKERYGGDFGEALHDGNFCMDGIVTADRKCKSGTYEMKKCYQPVCFTLDENGVCAYNKNYFAPLCGVLKICVGETEKTYEVCIAPRESVCLPCDTDKTVYAEFTRQGENEPCAHEQFYVNAYMPRAFSQNGVEFSENARYIFIRGGVNEYTLDKTSGEIVCVKVDGKELGGVAFNLWRAPTDNDMYVRKDWERKFVHLAKPNALKCAIDGNRVCVSMGVGYGRSIYLVEAEVTYTFYADGVQIDIEYNTERKYEYEYYRYLPRIGWKMKLPKAFNKVEYLAYGAGETYADMYDFAVKKTYTANVEDEYFHYSRPQESGSHYLPEYAELTDGETYIRAEGMRSFCAISYAAETLVKAKHDDELPTSENTYFCADYYMTGLGTGSCGPWVAEPYQTPAKGDGQIRLYFYKK